MMMVENSTVASSSVFITRKSIEFNSTKMSIIARLPTINVFGVSLFEKLLLKSWEVKIEIHGNISFSTLYVSKPIVIFSNIEGSGTYVTGGGQLYQELTIPWTDVLASPYHLVLTLFIFTVLVYTVLKRKR
jgi:hypothetical protein